MSMDDSSSPTAVARAARREELQAKKLVAEASVESTQVHLARHPNDPAETATLESLRLQIAQLDAALRELDDVVVCSDEVHA
ncbi:hypothetical protein TSOC_004867 [Tetrabaena socialis]|uniref:Uncharacterized protein n=1 Tax=Tetrabaena socialis TaxID=47790 RepID=A0A2J8A7P8_9CHLO|nr:hypothetical protein TSOC_004867 [Tetrabaena socialis]|eukprot:PNH08559.1 hypothetical protein TSOC_004867 [Tetrabaena socialis]